MLQFIVASWLIVIIVIVIDLIPLVLIQFRLQHGIVDVKQVHE